jgi:hypothetical protein
MDHLDDTFSYRGFSVRISVEHYEWKPDEAALRTVSYIPLIQISADTPGDRNARLRIGDAEGQPFVSEEGAREAGKHAARMIIDDRIDGVT